MERRESAFRGQVRDQPARIGEQVARALDQQHRLDVGFGHAGDPEQAAEHQFDMEHRVVFAGGGGDQLQVHLEQAVRAAAGVELHAEVDGRLRQAAVQGVRRAGALERQVANELGQDADARAGRRRVGAVGRRGFGRGVGHGRRLFRLASAILRRGG